MEKRPKITVIGSINMDLVTSTDLFPKQGETVRGSAFQTVPGGKGANQAVASARLGAQVNMIGCVGSDSFGGVLLKNLQKENINIDNIKRIEDSPSGLANIILSEKDNRIIIISGANAHVTPEFIEESKATILDSDYVLVQFEIPKETIEYCIHMCADHQIPIIVNPAPAFELSHATCNKASYITPNQTEWQQLFNNNWNEKLIVTKGAQGVSFMEKGSEKHISSHAVEVIDSTGAGDTFNGALAVALAEGKSKKEAVNFANAAAALSIGKLGAQGGMPTKDKVEQFLSKG
ncbi:ribokinase [Gracilibacillus kekensis]|uniref:Ribokinase n=1 Tax=Gracilibacillus kekensis TaxID=1027249 RepID=A0A1M7Q867_9BACI|nr:ribokinase [Gracilibacillus kekensis]SHN26632.1 ribokinase [Gracilibacillus kekensis]